MTDPSQTEEMKRYLFGEMPAEERETVESRLFAETDFFYALTDLENDLVDRYVHEKLAGEELARFERSLEKIPGRREKIANARALKTFVQEEKATAAPLAEKSLRERIRAFFDFQNTNFRLIAAAAVVLMICLFGLLIYRDWQRRNDFAEIEKRREAEQTEKENRLRQLEEQQQLELERRERENLNAAAPPVNSETRIEDEKRKNEIEKLKNDLENLHRKKVVSPSERNESKPAREFLAVAISPVGRGGAGNVTADLIDDTGGKQRVKITVELPDDKNYGLIEIVSKSGTASRAVPAGAKAVVFFLPPEDTEIQIKARTRGALSGFEPLGNFALKLTPNKK